MNKEVREQAELEKIIRENINETEMSFGNSGDIEMIDIDPGKTAKMILDAGYRLIKPESLTVLSVDEILAVSRRDGLCPIVDTMGIKICQAVAQEQRDQDAGTQRRS